MAGYRGIGFQIERAVGIELHLPDAHRVETGGAEPIGPQALAV